MNFLNTKETASLVRRPESTLRRWRSGGKVGGAFQGWAMIVNPFFSPAVRIQTERGHHLILTGPYRLMQHPGYFAISISVPASALAIGSWIALMPAAGFVLLINHRAHLEDEFLRNNLPGYIAYARRVGGPYAR